MTATTQQMQATLDKYFEAWRTKDSDALIALFAPDGIYRVKPFGIEEYHGTDAIRGYWEEHPVTKQQNPNPKCLQVAFGNNVCFAEWQNDFINTEGVHKITQGILLLEFTDGLVTELREHYLSVELPAHS